MPVYLISGVSRGLGFGFLKVLSIEKDNFIVGLVRDKAYADAKIRDELSSPSNIAIIQADMSKYADLEAAVPLVQELTGGKIDYLIANAAIAGSWSAFRDIETLAREPRKLEEDYYSTFRTNVLGSVHLFNLFMPFVLAGNVKKVIHISSAQAAADLIVDHDLWVMTPYGASKAAMNIVTSKYGGYYKAKEVLFLNIAPGAVATEYYRDGDMTEEIQINIGSAVAAMKAYAPHFEKDATPLEAAEQVLAVIRKASIEQSAGRFVSQFGTQQWL